jgi:acetyl-CoA synthetase
MAPTEYRVMARRTMLSSLPDLQGAVAAGEALNPGVIEAWCDAPGLSIRDGYGQTESGQITANPPGEPARPGSARATASGPSRSSPRC